MQSPSWEANWFAASQEIPRISRNPKVHYRTHKRPPPLSILGQPNPVHIPTSHLLEIHPNIIHPSTPRSPQWFPSLRFPHQDPIHPLSSPIRATRIIILHYNSIILWESRRICGPSLIEMSLCGAYLWIHRVLRPSSVLCIAVERHFKQHKTSKLAHVYFGGAWFTFRSWHNLALCVHFWTSTLNHHLWSSEHTESLNLKSKENLYWITSTLKSNCRIAALLIKCPVTIWLWSLY